MYIYINVFSSFVKAIYIYMDESFYKDNGFVELNASFHLQFYYHLLLLYISRFSILPGGGEEGGGGNPTPTLMSTPHQ